MLRGQGINCGTNFSGTKFQVTKLTTFRRRSKNCIDKRNKFVYHNLHQAADSCRYKFMHTLVETHIRYDTGIPTRIFRYIYNRRHNLALLALPWQPNDVCWTYKLLFYY